MQSKYGIVMVYSCLYVVKEHKDRSVKAGKIHFVALSGFNTGGLAFPISNFRNRV